ncbi:hypothetical protein ACFL35_06005 [Candidatus Riflebacteria bacterium]
MKKFGLSMIFVTFFYANLLAAGSRCDSSCAKEKACYANIRVLMGAVEMFNMDHSGAMMEDLEISLLVENGYLKKFPICPSRGSYLGKNLEANGLIKCSKHGNPARKEAQKKACKANIRVLWGAVEMYNMDHGGRKEGWGGEMKILDIKKLVKDGYLNRAPVCPAKGSYSGEYLDDNNEGIIQCSFHDALSTASTPVKKKSIKNKACTANIRVLWGAVDMYNMDHGGKKEGWGGDMKTLEINKLVKDGYLKRAPVCPAKGSYSGKYLHDNNEGTIGCSVHGVPGE